MYYDIKFGIVDYDTSSSIIVVLFSPFFPSHPKTKNSH